MKKEEKKQRQRQYLNLNASIKRELMFSAFVLNEMFCCFASGNRFTYWYTFPFCQPTKRVFSFIILSLSVPLLPWYENEAVNGPLSKHSIHSFTIDYSLNQSTEIYWERSIQHSTELLCRLVFASVTFITLESISCANNCGLLWTKNDNLTSVGNDRALLWKTNWELSKNPCKTQRRSTFLEAHVKWFKNGS